MSAELEAAFGLGGAPTAAWLHNMSVPSRSTLTVRREWIGGRCFEVCPGVRVGPCETLCADAPGWVTSGLRRGGHRALLALLLEPPDPLDSWRARVGALRRTLARQRDVETRAAAAVNEALRAAGVPTRVGVFVPRGATAPPRATPLGFAASLAVLGRRSGPLYLPSRQVDGSLIQLTDVVLAFPDGQL